MEIQLHYVDQRILPLKIELSDNDAAHLDRNSQKAMAIKAAHDAGTSLRGLDLSGADFTGYRLENYDFRYTRMNNITFRDAHIVDSEFYYVEMMNFDMTAATFERVTFDGSKLISGQAFRAFFNEVRFDGGMMIEVEFNRARLLKVTFDLVRLALSVFTDTAIEDSTFNGHPMTSGPVQITIPELVYAGVYVNGDFLTVGCTTKTVEEFQLYSYLDSLTHRSQEIARKWFPALNAAIERYKIATAKPLNVGEDGVGRSDSF